MTEASQVGGSKVAPEAAAGTKKSGYLTL